MHIYRHVTFYEDLSPFTKAPSRLDDRIEPAPIQGESSLDGLEPMMTQVVIPHSSVLHQAPIPHTTGSVVEASQDLPIGEQPVEVSQDLPIGEQPSAERVDPPQLKTYFRRPRPVPTTVEQPVLSRVPEDHPLPVSSPDKVRRSDRIQFPIDRFVSYDSFSKKHRAFVSTVHSTREPSSFHEASSSACWRQAMKEEVLSARLGVSRETSTFG